MTTVIATEATTAATEATVVATEATVAATKATRASYMTTTVSTKSTVVSIKATAVPTEATNVATEATRASHMTTTVSIKSTVISTKSTAVPTEAATVTTEAPSYPSTLRTTAGGCGAGLVTPGPSLTPEPGAPLQVLAGRPVLRVAPLRPSVIRRLAVPLDPVVLVSEGQVGALAPAVNSVGGSLSVGGLCPDGLGGEERD